MLKEFVLSDKAQVSFQAWNVACCRIQVSVVCIYVYNVHVLSVDQVVCLSVYPSGSIGVPVGSQHAGDFSTGGKSPQDHD